jgi:molybdopterin/thiamine biosynthesis adenylyltransferase
MIKIPERYDRSMLLFGADGQRALGGVAVAIVGSGGVGSALAQHTALLGVRRITSIDPEELDETNRNRFIGARITDAVPGTLKVAIIDRLIRQTNPHVDSVPIPKSLLSVEAFDAIKASDWVFGCLDDDGPRAVLNELCAAYGHPYIDLAADVPAGGIYGGRVCVAIDGDGCLECLGQFDKTDVRRYFESEEQRDREDAVYGVARHALNQRGPRSRP